MATSEIITQSNTDMARMLPVSASVSGKLEFPEWITATQAFQAHWWRPGRSQKPGFLQLAAERTHPMDQKPGFFFQLWIRLDDIFQTGFGATGSRSHQ